MSFPSKRALLILLATGCQGNDQDRPDSANESHETASPFACDLAELPAEDIGLTDQCSEPEDGFEPVVEWSYGDGQGCLSQPLVVDVDGDGAPEVVFNQTDPNNCPGQLVVLKGDGSGLLWQDEAAKLAFASPPAAGDIDGDGMAEIVVVREYGSSLSGDSEYAAAMYGHDGTELWESEYFTMSDFDWATTPVITDMDHDGAHEIVVGRVILDAATGSTRGVGAHGRGSYGVITVGHLALSSASVPVVTDLDLDGVEEVIVGDAAYDIHGNTLRHDDTEEDAMMAAVNLDGDPEGELIAISWNTVRAQDTDGSLLWGPVVIPSAHVLATPAIGDLDLDGYPEIVTAGGNQLVCLNHDGSTLWTAAVNDQSGATGASIFDFEGDGLPDVVYIDEVEMVVYDGGTGAVRFSSTEHASNTAFDYPTIADVDGDDQAEIVVCHNGYGVALLVYGDAEERWKPARPIWNQHAYDIGNVEDDGTVPSTREYGFTTHNTWHSAIATDGVGLQDDLEVEISDVCLDECDLGKVWIAVRLRNRGLVDTSEDVGLALYTLVGVTRELLTTFTVPAGVPRGSSTEANWVELDAADLEDVNALWLVADDDGTGTGSISECSETNNAFELGGPFCG